MPRNRRPPTKAERRLRRELSISILRARVAHQGERDLLDRLGIIRDYEQAKARGRRALNAFYRTEWGQKFSEWERQFEVLYDETSVAYLNGGQVPPRWAAPRPPEAGRNSIWWQEAILEALASGSPMTTGAIASRLPHSGPDPTDRVTLSRGLARLCAKGLIERLQPSQTLPGRGYLYRRNFNR